MAFLSPLTLIGLSLVALPLLIHLLVRRRARRWNFPSLAFLRETPSFKLYPRRIRQPLLLILRAAAIILLVMGLARPLLNLQPRAPEAVRFILLDASLSMKTRGRAEAAREQARAIVNKLRGGERACVISFSSEAEVLVEPSADQSKLLKAIESYQPTGGATDYEVGLAAIITQLRGESQVANEVDIISDFQKSGLEGKRALTSRGGELRVVTYPVGSEIERNAFLIDERVRKSAGGIELSATEMVSANDGRKGVRDRWTIDAKEGARPGIEWRTEANGQITGRASVLEPDDFDADDERFFAFNAPREIRVLLIEDEKDADPYLRAALEAAGDEGTDKLDRRRELPSSAEDLSSYSLVVLTLHGAPREHEWGALFEYARAGGTVWVCLARDLDTESWNAFARSQSGQELPFESLTRMSGGVWSFGSADLDAPALRALDESAFDGLRAVHVNAGYALSVRASADTLVRWNDDQPAFVSSRVGEGEVLVLATSPARASSDLGASPALPALASAILRAGDVRREPLSLNIGESVRLNVRPETDVRITNTEGRAFETKARELVVRPLSYFNEPGIYRLEFAGKQKFIAFNSPAAESERALQPEASLSRLFSVEGRERAKFSGESNRREAAERSGSTWRYFLAAAFLLMIAELFLAIRAGRVETIVSE